MSSISSSALTNINGVQVWKISISQNIQFLLSQYQAVLTKEEQTKSEDFFHKKDRESYLTRRIMSRLLLAVQMDCLAVEIRFIEGENKKPEISYPVTPVKFNISHSGDYVVMAISRSPVGIDVEKIKPEFQFKEIMSRFFTAEEQAFILKDKDKALEAFFLLWTRKEAYLKYTSEGLLDDLKNMPDLLTHSAMDFQVQSPFIHPDYSCSLVYPSNVSRVDYFEYDYSKPIIPFSPYFFEV